MNTERYIWPVIIAAGLHGALLLSGIDRNPPPIPDEGAVPPVLPPVTRIEMTELETDPGEPGAGKAEPLPAQPDIPRPVTTEDIFTVQVTPAAPSLKPVLTLPKNPMGSIGPEGPGPDTGHLSLPNIHDLDRIPRATVRPAPNYPATMRNTDTSGSVTVEFVVDTTGRVVAAEAVNWTHRDFVEPAVRAVLRWRFEPGTLDGRKVSFRMAVPIEFNAG